MSGDELKFSRQRIGLTHEDLARFARVSVGTVERWELGGSSIPRALRLRVLLTQLEIKRRELLSNATESQQHWENWLAQHLSEEMADSEP
jgi:transcriptional regulator with XRE-family HTH domain